MSIKLLYMAVLASYLVPCALMSMQENNKVLENTEHLELKDMPINQLTDEQYTFESNFKSDYLSKYIDMSPLKKEDAIEKIIDINDNKLLLYKNEVLNKVFNAFEKNDTLESSIEQHGAVRAFYRYLLNSEKKHDARGLYIIIHGTFGSENENYWKPDSKVFSTLLEELGKSAGVHECDMDLLSFQWTGEDSNSSRINAGEFLGKKLINRMKKEYEFIRVVAHSHGGNVFNVACHELDDDCVIDRAFYLGTPVMEQKDWRYMPINIKKIFNLYSWYDGVQYLGSFNWKNESSSKWPQERIKPKTNYNDGQRFNNMDTQGHIWNILFALDGEYPDHTDMAQIILSSNPYEFSNKIELAFDNITDLSVNIIPDEKAVSYKVDPINITLHKDLKVETIDEKIVELSNKYLKEHDKVYNFTKDNVSTIYVGWRVVKGIFKSLF